MLLQLSLGILLLHSLAEAKMPKLSKETRNEILDTFNTLRRNVTPTASNMLKMEWSNHASETAAKWASQCKLKASDVTKDRVVNGSYCGESLSATNFIRPWSDVISDWYKTKSNFEYGVVVADPKKQAAFIGYTQVVWYNSHRVGCALGYCPNSERPFYYVCHYCPAGNIKSKLATPYKKGPSCEDCPNNCEDKLCTNACPYHDMLDDCSKMIEKLGCKNEKLIEKCKGSCTCKTEII